jgi:hypothetical protein
MGQGNFSKLETKIPKIKIIGAVATIIYAYPTFLRKLDDPKSVLSKDLVHSEPGYKSAYWFGHVLLWAQAAGLAIAKDDYRPYLFLIGTNLASGLYELGRKLVKKSHNHVATDKQELSDLTSI